ncbi:organic solute transporter Ostalpha-domain-containing protein [Rhodocollybia butyracea]|uniref:Organic solute transporter Ostalpha-domain-containing protein n=1 Tax=Rhodocollybia butyracea TaxID=206335 RepID=A0A9P5PZR6_9AGAR|nr:organic solute transporter Ostalpha-domain-containing protein [Rhodocollybia butyracea]
MANITDGRCWTVKTPSSPAMLQGGNLIFQAHHVGWIVAGFFTITAIITSAWLINKHLVFYTDKREQRYIIRILFMVPIYAITSMASYLFWNESTPLLLIQDGYEATVLTKPFFLKNGLSRANDQEALRNHEMPKNWVFPLGFVKWKPKDGLYFLQLMKWGVLQYCVIRPTTALAAVLLNYVGLYCEDSWSPGWGHVYITVIVSISVTIAMYCLIQLYVSVAKVLAPQKPLLKLFSIKAVVFLTFWQSTFLSVLSMFGVVKSTTFMTADDINIGIGALLETFEMMLFGFIHIKAFTYKPYRPGDPSDLKELPTYRMSRLRALGHALDFRETFRELWTGTIYLWDKMCGRDPKPDTTARRAAHYESAFGAARPSGVGREVPSEKKKPLAFPMIQVEREYHDSIHGRQWLGYGNDYGYGVYREKSDDLEIQIEKELERRGYGSQLPELDNIRKPNKDTENTGHAHQRSWWRSIYNRVSQSVDDDNKNLTSAPSRRSSHRKSKIKSRELSKSRSRNPSLAEHNMDDLPPASLFRPKRSSGQGKGAYSPVAVYDEDMLAPLSVFNEHQNTYLQRQSQHQTLSPRHHSNVAGSPPLAPVNHLPRIPLSPSNPPPQSLLVPLMMPRPQGTVSADSLLGRVFPSKSSDANHTAHGTDNTHSTGYVRNSPRVPLPPSEGGHDIGFVSERKPVHAQPSNMPQAFSVAVISPASSSSEAASTSRSKDSLGPLVIQEAAWIAPKLNRTPPSGSPKRPGHGLRRSSAQIYSPHEAYKSKQPPPARSSPPRQSKRHSTPVILTVPRPLVTPPNNIYSAENRGSPNTTTPHYFDNSSSAAAELSLSAMANNSPIPIPDFVLDDSISVGGSRYPDPGVLNHGQRPNHLTTQQAQSNQRAYKYPSHTQYSGSLGGPSNAAAHSHQSPLSRIPRPVQGKVLGHDM